MSAHCSLPPPNSQVVFFVLCDLGSRGLEWVARDPARTNRSDTLHDIRSGELPNVRQIIETEFTAQGLSSRDVTEDLLAEVEHLRHPNTESVMSAFDRLIGQIEHDQDIRKHWCAR